MPAGQSYLSDDGSGVHNRTAETFPIDLPLRECCARVNSCDRRVRSDGDGLRVAETPVVAGNGLRSAIVWHRRVRLF